MVLDIQHAIPWLDIQNRVVDTIKILPILLTSLQVCNRGIDSILIVGVSGLTTLDNLHLLRSKCLRLEQRKMELGKVIRGLPERCRASNLPRLPNVFGSSPRGSTV